MKLSKKSILTVVEASAFILSSVGAYSAVRHVQKKRLIKKYVNVNTLPAPLKELYVKLIRVLNGSFKTKSADAEIAMSYVERAKLAFEPIQLIEQDLNELDEILDTMIIADEKEEYENLKQELHALMNQIVDKVEAQKHLASTPTPETEESQIKELRDLVDTLTQELQTKDLMLESYKRKQDYTNASPSVTQLCEEQLFASSLSPIDTSNYTAFLPEEEDDDAYLEEDFEEEDNE